MNRSTNHKIKFHANKIFTTIQGFSFPGKILWLLSGLSLITLACWVDEDFNFDSLRVSSCIIVKPNGSVPDATLDVDLWLRGLRLNQCIKYSGCSTYHCLLNMGPNQRRRHNALSIHALWRLHCCRILWTTNSLRMWHNVTKVWTRRRTIRTKGRLM